MKLNINICNKAQSSSVSAFRSRNLWAGSLLCAAVLCMFPVQTAAQDIYKVEMLSGEDLNGTARYVGMGGAMSALGADLSTMATNPAGIGMYRSNDIALSFGLTSQKGAEDFYDIGASRLSFDQAGFVLKTSWAGDDLRFINFAFNYHKRRNFKTHYATAGRLGGGLSQSREMYNLMYSSADNVFANLDITAKPNDREYVAPIALLGYETYLADVDDMANLYTPDFYTYRRVHWGGVEQYDFNIGCNWRDNFYFGLTVGAYNVNYHNGLLYTEEYNAVPSHLYEMTNEESITGHGFDIKAGIILRPIKDSPFRIGFSVSTPVWYELSYDYYTGGQSPYANPSTGQLYSWNTVALSEEEGRPTGRDYNLRTPWKFNFSMATTIANRVALGAEYEIADYSSCNVSYPDYNDYDAWTDSYGSNSDRDMRGEIGHNLSTVSTVRVGAECAVAKGAYLRAGYNYVSAPFKEYAQLNPNPGGESYYYQGKTDYVNIGSTNRFTVGAGLRSGDFYADLAYQYQNQDATVYPFQIMDNDAAMSASAVIAAVGRMSGQKVSNERHNVLLTLGYKF